ncbi:MAG: fibronectin type III domain-containing protein, partial [Bdellovibrio sp.]|nr:fibronectin type III domain-containing protein [Bdellovibrio sp.]
MRKPWSILNIQIFVLLVATVGSLSGCLKPRDSASTGVPSSTWFAGAAAAQNLGGSPSAIKVTWTRADRSTVGYNIYSLRPNGTTGSSEWTLVGSVDGDQTSYTDSENLYEGQIYTYK